MESVSNLLANLATMPYQSHLLCSEYKCEECLDNGWIFVQGRGAKECECRTQARTERKLAAIPPEYAGLSLSGLKADDKFHPKQAALLQLVRSQPERSFVLLGRNGCGKSLIGWLMYRRAVESGQAAAFMGVADLLLEFKEWELDDSKLPTLDPYSLRTKERALIILDEFEKARPTEFASEKLFLLLDTIKVYQHQLVVISNATQEELLAHWGRNGHTYGRSIMQRVVGLPGVALVNMF